MLPQVEKLAKPVESSDLKGHGFLRVRWSELPWSLHLGVDILCGPSRLSLVGF